MKRIIGFGLGVLVTVTATACGGDSQGKDAVESTPIASATPHSTAASQNVEDKIVLHDFLGRDITVKELRDSIVPGTNCKKMLSSGKENGNKYPNGEDLFLRICTESSQK